MMSSQTATFQSPFAPAPAEPEPRSTIERLTGKSRPDLARLALQRYLALTPIDRLSTRDVHSIIERYGLVHGQAHALRIWAYETAMMSYWGAGEPSSSERAYLRDLQRAIDLGTEDAQRIHSSTTLARFNDSVKEAFQHDVPTTIDRSVRQLGVRFGFDEIDSRRLYQEAVVQWKQTTLADCKRRRRLSLAENERIDAIANALQLQFTDDEKAWVRGAFLAQYVEDGGELQPIDTTGQVNLQKNEACYGVTAGLWMEVLARSRKTDHGTAYFTDSRLIFSGSQKSIALRYSSILAVDKTPSLISDFTALQFRKGSGNPPQLLVPESSVDMVELLIGRLMRGDISGSHRAISTTASSSVSAPEPAPAAAAVPKQPRGVGDRKLEASLQPLNELVGLDSIHGEVTSLINVAKNQQLRRAQGLPTAPLTYHCVFTGNPGTGKTTVARILADVFRALGLLSKGHLVETDRSGLVGGYVGQTALKTTGVVQSAIGGILFIDEAYALATASESDYGREAIETLLKLMEDNREDLVVIVAGYTEPMARFLQSNPGLRSRFNRFIDFPDYEPSALLQILERTANREGYRLTEDAITAASRVIVAEYESRSSGFGNGRFVRNLFERMMTNQANRLSASEPSRDDLMTLTESDLG